MLTEITETCETNLGVPVPYHWDAGALAENGTTSVGFWPMGSNDMANSAIEALVYGTSTTNCYKTLDVWNIYFIDFGIVFIIAVAVAIGLKKIFKK